jgi:hypothetical protein
MIKGNPIPKYMPSPARQMSNANRDANKIADALYADTVATWLKECMVGKLEVEMKKADHCLNHITADNHSVETLYAQPAHIPSPKPRSRFDSDGNVLVSKPQLHPCVDRPHPLKGLARKGRGNAEDDMKRAGI